ncbi:hypothetical protein GOODEAATRI_025732, partial [Goodea atripinnis]
LTTQNLLGIVIAFSCLSAQVWCLQLCWLSPKSEKDLLCEPTSPLPRCEHKNRPKQTGPGAELPSASITQQAS